MISYEKYKEIILDVYNNKHDIIIDNIIISFDRRARDTVVHVIAEMNYNYLNITPYISNNNKNNIEYKYSLTNDVKKYGDHVNWRKNSIKTYYKLKKIKNFDTGPYRRFMYPDNDNISIETELFKTLVSKNIIRENVELTLTCGEDSLFNYPDYYDYALERNYKIFTLIHQPPDIKSLPSLLHLLTLLNNHLIIQNMSELVMSYLTYKNSL